MANRAADWLKQAEADLRHARHAREWRDFEWSCFAAHQAAEKALKAVFLHRGQEAWGHTLTALIGNLFPAGQAPAELDRAARLLDKHYIPTRYPNGFDSGAPTDFYTAEEAEQAIRCAEDVLGFGKNQVG